MKLIYLAENYDLVVGDRFEMFYRGIIRSMNPYKYYIYVNCQKGAAYPRYYTYTPKPGDEGEYKLRVALYDDYHELIEEAFTTIHVYSPKKPKKQLNILCIGDSLTVNGVWPYVGYSRLVESDNEYKNLLNFMGTMHKDEVGYEGYGGWQWRHFVTNEAVGMHSSVWVEVDSHNLDENDQHSEWLNEGLEWILETIEEKKLKFKRGGNNYSCFPTVGKTFTNKEGGIHKEDIHIKSYEFEEGNPFYDKQLQGPNFKKYIEDHNYPGLDIVYILLTWNGQYMPYNEDFSHYEPFIIKLIDKIKEDYPKALVRLIGIQSPSINGGIAANYGASGFYHDVFGEVSSAFNYAKYLESLANRNEYKGFVKYIDMKAQFDVENNMPQTLVKVNARSEKEELIGTNGVHPTMDGYLQIGDVFYRALVADLNKE